MALSAEIFLVVVQFRLKVLWSFFEGRFCSKRKCANWMAIVGNTSEIKEIFFPTDISQKNHTLTGGYRWYRGGFLEHVNIARKLLVILPPQQNNALAKKRLKGIICLSNRSSMAKRCIKLLSRFSSLDVSLTMEEALRVSVMYFLGGWFASALLGASRKWQRLT